MVIPERSFSTQAYRYGFNGIENDSEPKETMNLYGAVFRTLDVRIARWFSHDPKNIPAESPYSLSGLNPISYSDPLGDSIKTKFEGLNKNEFDQYGVPSQIQKMFNQEYGIGVSYNKKTEMLYFREAVVTNQAVSNTAKGEFMNALTATGSDRKLRREFGEFTIGRNLRNPYGGMGYVDGGESSGKNIYLNLNSFNDDNLAYSKAEYVNVPVRAFNMARTLEHEWIGHFRNRKSDPIGARQKFAQGNVVRIVNEIRVEIGLEKYQRVHYGNAYFTLFGDPGSLNNRELQKLVKSETDNLLQYRRNVLNGGNPSPPNMNFGYIKYKF
jgi:RHS repeat-associated protein